jgi:hypothetical protein
MYRILFISFLLSLTLLLVFTHITNIEARREIFIPYFQHIKGVQVNSQVLQNLTYSHENPAFSLQYPSDCSPPQTNDTGGYVTISCVPDSFNLQVIWVQGASGQDLENAFEQSLNQSGQLHVLHKFSGTISGAPATFVYYLYNNPQTQLLIFFAYFSGEGYGFLDGGYGAIETSVSLALYDYARSFLFGSAVHSVTFTETGLPQGTQWSVTFGGMTKTSTQSNITFADVPNGSYDWNASALSCGSGCIYAPFPFNGTLNVPSQTSVELNYTKEFEIDVGISPKESGSVVIQTGETKLTLDYNTSIFAPLGSVLITAVANPGYAFDGWEYSGSMIQNTSAQSTLLTLTSPMRLSVSFVKTVTISVSYSFEQESPGVKPMVSYKLGLSNITLVLSSTTTQITVNEGSVVKVEQAIYSSNSGERWYTNTSSFLATQGERVNLVYVHQFYVEVDTNSPFAGNVSPSSAWFDAGTQLTLSATPSNGWKFVRWSSGTSTLIVNSPIKVVAIFYAKVTLNVGFGGSVSYADGNITGSVSGTKTIYLPPNTKLSLNANPTILFSFNGWGGALSGGSSQTLLVNGPMNVRASFAPNYLELALIGVAVTAVVIFVVRKKSPPPPPPDWTPNK